jgi:hypothetical protein
MKGTLLRPHGTFIRRESQIKMDVGLLLRAALASRAKREAV